MQPFAISRMLTLSSILLRHPITCLSSGILVHSTRLLSRNIGSSNAGSSAFRSSLVAAKLRGGAAPKAATVPADDDIPDYPTTSENFIARYNGPPDDEMTDEQREIRDDIIRTRPRTGISGPFGPWLAVPEIGWPSQQLGRACRYGTSLTMRESELIILLTGARHKAHAEFDIHQSEALRSGLTMEIISAIPRDDEFSMGKVTADLLPLLSENERDTAIAKYTAELLETSTVSDETYQETLKAVGGEESVLVEITSIIGYYTYVAYTLNAFNIPFKK